MVLSKEEIETYQEMFNCTVLEKSKAPFGRNMCSNLLETVQAKQQEIDSLKRQLNCERQTVSMLKSFGLHYGEFPRLEADKLIDKLVSDKDEQAKRMMQLDNGLKKLRTSFQWLSETIRDLDYKAWAEDKIDAINAMLGGAEDAENAQT